MKIGIFTAMEKEAASFLRGDVKRDKIGAFNVYSFKLGAHDAVLCCPPTVGEIAASAACQLLISQMHADIILNFGVVGALSEQAQLLSAMYVGSVVHYDMDLSQIDGLPVGRYDCFDDIALNCDVALLQKAKQMANLPVVRCASGDCFMSDADKKTALNRNFGAEICDMEAAGVLFTCTFNNIPCLLVKCVSDSLVGGCGEYSQNARRAAENFFQFAQKLSEVL